MSIKLYGESDSVYVRFARLALAEKQVSYDLVPVDIFASDGPSPEHLRRHPFGKIPAFEHDGFELFETLAITRYVDEAFEGPTLVPDDLHERARMNQITALVDSYVYRSFVWGVYTGSVSDPRDGLPRDEEQIAQSLVKAKLCLETLVRLRGGSDWLVGNHVTLADLSLASMLAYFLEAPEGQEAWRDVPSLHPWWERLSARSSMISTRDGYFQA